MNNSPRLATQQQLLAHIAASPRQAAPVQRAPAPPRNTTGLPDQLKAGIEQLSGHSLDDVQVHYNSAKPAQLQAHAYAQGADIHVAPDQEKHLPHEAWHVVQQKQGRVRATRQLKGMSLNDDAGLEKEADAMGRQAVQLKRAGTPLINVPSPTIGKTVQLTKWRWSAGKWDALPGTYVGEPGSSPTQDGAAEGQEVEVAITPSTESADRSTAPDTTHQSAETGQVLAEQAATAAEAEAREIAREGAAGASSIILPQLTQIGYTCYLYAALNSESERPDGRYAKGTIETLLRTLTEVANGTRTFKGAKGSPGNLGYTAIIGKDAADKSEKSLSAYQAGASIVARLREKSKVDHALAVIPLEGGQYRIMDSSKNTSELLSSSEAAEKYMLYVKPRDLTPTKRGKSNYYSEEATRELHRFFLLVKAPKKDGEGKVYSDKKRSTLLKASLLKEIDAYRSRFSGGQVSADVQESLDSLIGVHSKLG